MVGIIQIAGWLWVLVDHDLGKVKGKGSVVHSVSPTLSGHSILPFYLAYRRSLPYADVRTCPPLEVWLHI